MEPHFKSLKTSRGSYSEREVLILVKIHEFYLVTQSLSGLESAKLIIKTANTCL
jgi:hypothetical protein